MLNYKMHQGSKLVNLQESYKITDINKMMTKLTFALTRLNYTTGKDFTYFS